MIEKIVENPNDMTEQNLMAIPQEVLQILPSGAGHLEGESQTKIVDDSISGILSHDEDLLNVSDSRMLDTGVLETVYSEHI